MSPIGDFAGSGFRPLLGDDSVSGAKRVVLCSGKVYHDLADARAEAGLADSVALVRLEQLYPFPRKALLEEVARHPDADLVWAQEEPRNMGPWTHLRERFEILDLDRQLRRPPRPPRRLRPVRTSATRPRQQRLLAAALADTSG